jgi:hypothetical protein
VETAATLISGQASSGTASLQLDHSSAITRDFYICKPAIAADVDDVLQDLSDPAPGGRNANTSGD